MSVDHIDRVPRWIHLSKNDVVQVCHVVRVRDHSDPQKEGVCYITLADGVEHRVHRPYAEVAGELGIG
jgi:hypothetical protein